MKLLNYTHIIQEQQDRSNEIGINNKIRYCKFEIICKVKIDEIDEKQY